MAKLWKGDRVLGQVDSDGRVFVGGSVVGRVDFDGKVWQDANRLVGSVDSDGKVWQGDRIVGRVGSDGKVWQGDRIVGAVEGGKLADGAAVIFFGLNTNKTLHNVRETREAPKSFSDILAEGLGILAYYVLHSKGGKIGVLIALFFGFILTLGSKGEHIFIVLIFTLVLMPIFGVIGFIIDSVVSNTVDNGGDGEWKESSQPLTTSNRPTEFASTKHLETEDERKKKEEKVREDKAEQRRKKFEQNRLETEKNPVYFTDPRDGHKYRTVKIGKQTWMAQNLNYQPQSGKFWSYDNDDSKNDKYGRLYDWNTAVAVCPIGWHLPSRQEWLELITMTGESEAGVALKSEMDWERDGNGTDDCGFSALPGGSRKFDGDFENIGTYGKWWSATENGNDNAYFRYTGYNLDRVIEGINFKSTGFSVRCVRDETN